MHRIARWLDRTTGAKSGVLLAAVVFYVVAVFLAAELGTPVLHLAAIPALVGALLFGMWAGLLSPIPVLGLNWMLAQVLFGDGSETFSPAVLSGVLAAGLLAGAVGSLTSVQRMLDKELKRRDTLFARGFETSPMAAALVDLEGHVIRANPSLGELVELGRGELTGTNIVDFVHPSDVAKVTHIRDGLVDGSDQQVDVAVRMITSLKRTRRVMVAASVVFDREGGPLLLLQLTDVSALHEANAQLSDTIEAKDRFFATVAHELRTPLSVVQGLAEEMTHRASDFEPEDVVELAALLADYANDLGLLIDDLIVAGRVELEHLSFEKEPMDLATVAITELQRFSHQLSENDVLVKAPEEVCIVADGLRVRQVIRNLLKNAVRHGGPNVELNVALRGDQGVLYVDDDGSGVPASVADLLFEPHQTLGGRGGRDGSLGLGLYLSRRLARAMAGDLTYERVNGRTRFALYLPLVPDED